MRTQFSKFAFTASFVLALALTFSCSSDDDDERSYKYCVINNICYEGPFTASTCNGQPSNNCPNNGSSPSVSSSSSKPVSSSSSENGSSSSVSSSSSKLVSSSSVSGSSPSVSSSSSKSVSSSSISGSSSSSAASSSSALVVSYGGENYPTVKIGTQTWLAKNLNEGVIGKCYNNEPANCAIYGRMYDWATAMNLASSCNSSSCESQIQPKHRGICPPSWHIPTNAEWNTLIAAVGGSSTAGTKLKAASGWDPVEDVPAGTDEFGFAALPGGESNGDSFRGAGWYGNLWTASEWEESSGAYFREMGNNSEVVYSVNSPKVMLYNVRCLKD